MAAGRLSSWSAATKTTPERVASRHTTPTSITRRKCNEGRVRKIIDMYPPKGLEQLVGNRNRGGGGRAKLTVGLIFMAARKEVNIESSMSERAGRYGAIANWTHKQLIRTPG